MSLVGGAALGRPIPVQADSGAEWVADLAALPPVPDPSQSIDAFSGVIRVPRRDLALFAGLQVTDAGTFPVALDTPDVQYRIRLGPADGASTVAINGAAGRGANVGLSGGTGCVVSAEHYCSYRTFPGHAYAGSESFFLASAAGRRGTVAHNVADDDRQETTSWSVSWYAPDDDATYTLDIGGKLGPSIPLQVARGATNPNGMDPANLPVAQALLDLTDSFIGISGGEVVDEPPVSGDPTAALMARTGSPAAPAASGAAAVTAATGDVTGKVASDGPGTPLTVNATTEANVTSMVDTVSKPRDVFAAQLGADSDFGTSGRPRFFSFFFSSPNAFGGSYLTFVFSVSADPTAPPEPVAITNPAGCHTPCPLIEIGPGTASPAQYRCDKTEYACTAVRLYQPQPALLVITAAGKNQRYSLRVLEEL